MHEVAPSDRVQHARRGDEVAVEDLQQREERSEEDQLRDRVPAIVVIGQDAAGGARDSRIRFLGAPSGYEFISLVQAVLLVGGRESNLDEASRERVAAVAKPTTIQVFTTPT